MHDRSIPALRTACLSLAGLILLQLAWIAVRQDPLAGIRLPGNQQHRAPSKDQPDAKAGKSGSSSAKPAGPVQSAMMAGPGMVPGLADLPPGIKERIDRITDSEILGPVMRPPPMALLGIAGQDALIRAPNGQMGMVREGETVGGVKLLQIGINRVLIELDGHQQELMIFSGLGSETMLPKGKDHPQ